MKRTPLKRTPFRSKPKKRDPEHEAATKLALESECLLCRRTGTCVPAHLPRHRGSGGRFKHPWARRHWVPLCGEPGGCHEYLDGRAGGVSQDACYERGEAIMKVLEKAKLVWWTATGDEQDES